MVDSNDQQAEQPTVQWDDAGMSTSYANIVNLASSREEIMLFFGTNQTWNVGENREFKVKLSDRVILNPHAAKRLLLLLQRTIDTYEGRYGTLEIGTGTTGVKAPSS